MAGQPAARNPSAEDRRAALERNISDKLAAGENEPLLPLLRELLEIEPDHAPALFHLGCICDRLQRFDEAVPALERLLRSVPRLSGPSGDGFIAVRVLAHALIALGRTEDAERAIETARQKASNDAETRQWFARIHCDVGLDFYVTHRLEAATRQYREALALWPDMTGVVINLQHILATTHDRARLSDYCIDIKEHELKPYLFIACMPKSGSSFLKTALCALTGFPEQGLTYAYLQNEQDLYLPLVRDKAKQPIVTQQHCRATEANMQMMQAFGIRPIVLVRNIADVVSSLYDFYDGGATANTFFAPYWPKLTAAERLDLIVDHVVPWYLSFYASWAEAEKQGRLDIMWLVYRNMIADKPSALARVAEFHRLNVSPAKILEAIAAAEGDRHATRFNKGVVGRGSDMLTADQKARMARLASAYRGLDFSRIGL